MLVAGSRPVSLAARKKKSSVEPGRHMRFACSGLVCAEAVLSNHSVFNSTAVHHHLSPSLGPSHKIQ